MIVIPDSIGKPVRYISEDVSEESREELVTALKSAVVQGQQREDFDQCEMIADELIVLGWTKIKPHGDE